MVYLIGYCSVKIIKQLTIYFRLMKNNTEERNGTIELLGNLTQNNSDEFNVSVSVSLSYSSINQSINQPMIYFKITLTLLHDVEKYT